jgi:hypothetical protein
MFELEIHDSRSLLILVLNSTIKFEAIILAPISEFLALEHPSHTMEILKPSHEYEYAKSSHVL